jgi:very-short-patch-repair endonuclease
MGQRPIPGLAHVAISSARVTFWIVAGSPHYRDYVAAADATKRKRLKARGYRVLAIAGDQLEEGLDTLAQWLGG